MAEQQVQYQDLLEDNRQLQDQYDISLRDNFEVTEFLRHEILTKDGKIASLKSKMEEVGLALAQACHLHLLMGATLVCCLVYNACLHCHIAVTSIHVA